jgi:hypothetical protein
VPAKKAGDGFSSADWRCGGGGSILRCPSGTGCGGDECSGTDFATDGIGGSRFLYCNNPICLPAANDFFSAIFASLRFHCLSETAC